MMISLPFDTLIALLFTMIYATICLMYLFLYIVNPKEKLILWYTLLSGFIAGSLLDIAFNMNLTFLTPFFNIGIGTAICMCLYYAFQLQAYKAVLFRLIFIYIILMLVFTLLYLVTQSDFFDLLHRITIISVGSLYLGTIIILFFKDRLYCDRLNRFYFSSIITIFIAIMAAILPIRLGTATLKLPIVYFSQLYIFIISSITIGLKNRNNKNDLISLTHTLEQKVRERTAQLEQERVNRIRFFTNAAHETKTPLTLIKNYLDAFIEKKKLHKDQDLRIVRDNVLTLESDMLNFLDSENIERGQRVYFHEQILNLSNILAEKIKLFNPVFKKKQFTFWHNIEKNIHIKADNHAIDRIFNNLLDNAVKYTPNHGEINIVLKKRQNRVYFSVADNGPGISEEEQENIFIPYYRLSRETGNSQGTGMGLHIVKKIVESLAGEIQLDSHVGQGTTIMISLDNYDLKAADKVCCCKLEQPRDIAVFNREQKAIDTCQKNILLVEDDLNLLEIMYRHFKEDYNVFCALHGKEALEKLDSVRIDLIVSDLIMDVMDGYELIKKMPDNLRHIPFIFVTAKTTEKDKIEGLTHGAVDFIYKPFTAEELKLKVENHLENRSRADKKLLNALTYKIENYNRADPDQEFEDLCRNFNLTEAEKKVILLLKEGYDNKDLARKLNLSNHTVRNHTYHIFKKVGVKTRIELCKKMNFFA